MNAASHFKDGSWQPSLNCIVRHLSSVTLKQQEPLLGGKGTHGSFLEQGIASVVVTVENRDTVEVGIIGVDGVVFGPCGSTTRF